MAKNKEKLKEVKQKLMILIVKNSVATRHKHEKTRLKTIFLLNKKMIIVIGAIAAIM